MRWLVLRRAIYLLRRGRRLRQASHRDIEAAEYLVGWVYPGTLAPLPTPPTSASAFGHLLMGMA